MNKEIPLLYDVYIESTIQMREKHKYKNDMSYSHVHSTQAKCYIYRQCFSCKNVKVLELIKGMVYCIHHIKPIDNKKCRKYIYKFNNKRKK